VVNGGKLTASLPSGSVESLPIVVNSGDVMFDVALQTEKGLDGDRILSDLDLAPDGYILVTIHRAENTDNGKRLENIWDALTKIGATLDIPLFFPAHPRVRQAVDRLGFSVEPSSHIRLHEPVPYGEMLALEKNARFIITDSGGVQKEAYFFRTPTVIPRNESEWVELVDGGWALLAGADRENIIRKAWTVQIPPVKLPWEPYYGDGMPPSPSSGLLGSFLRQHGYESDKR